MLLLPAFRIFDGCVGCAGGISIVLVFYIKLTHFLSSYNFVRDLLSLFFLNFYFDYFSFFRFIPYSQYGGY